MELDSIDKESDSIDMEIDCFDIKAKLNDQESFPISLDYSPIRHNIVDMKRILFVERAME